MNSSSSSSSSFTWGGRGGGGGGGGGVGGGLFPPWDVLGISEEEFERWEGLIQKCWAPDPSARYEFSEIVHYLTPPTPSKLGSSGGLTSSSSPQVRPRDEEREERAKGLYMG